MPRAERSVQLPSHVQLAWPALVVLRRSCGGLSNREMEAAVAVEARLTDEQRRELRTPKSRSRTLLDYRLAWSRTMLKSMGAIVNDAPAHWVVTEQGHATTEADIRAESERMIANIGSGGR